MDPIDPSNRLIRNIYILGIEKRFWVCTVLLFVVRGSINFASSVSRRVCGWPSASARLSFETRSARNRKSPTNFSSIDRPFFKVRKVRHGRFPFDSRSAFHPRSISEQCPFKGNRIARVRYHVRDWNRIYPSRVPFVTRGIIISGIGKGSFLSYVARYPAR